MFDELNRKSEVFFLGFFLGWLLEVGGMALLLRDWTWYEAIALSVAYVVLGISLGWYVSKPVTAFVARRIRRLLGRSGAD